MVVEFLLDFVNLRPGDSAEVDSHGKILADEAAGVFIKSSLPCMVRMGRVACGFMDFIDELMHGKFLAVILSELRIYSVKAVLQALIHSFPIHCTSRG